MAHGTPDYGVTAGAVTTYQLKDLGELAARLGSPVTHDRRGDVIWWDDFECSLNKWDTTALGTGAAVALDTTRARNGRRSCLLTAGSDGSAQARISRSQPLPALSRIGFEASVNLPVATVSFAWEMIAADGADSITFAVQFDDVNSRLLYWSSGGVYTVFATGVNPSNDGTLFHTGKLVVDLTTRQYVRFIFDDRSYSLAGIAAEVTGILGSANLQLFLRHIGNAGDNDIVRVDDVILTVNEPA